MATKVKICGLKSEADIDTAIAGGADMIGIVFFAPSPRNIAIADGRRLADHARGRTRIVALMVDADDALVDQIAGDVAPDVLQLHGSEDVTRVRQIQERTGLPAIKAIKVASASDAAAAYAYDEVVEQILFDAKAPKDSPLPGGNGLRFDWRVLEGLQGQSALHAFGRADTGKRCRGDPSDRRAGGRRIFRRGGASGGQGSRANSRVSSGRQGPMIA